jgi:hypothetical protein
MSGPLAWILGITLLVCFWLFDRQANGKSLPSFHIPDAEEQKQIEKSQNETMDLYQIAMRRVDMNQYYDHYLFRSIESAPWIPEKYHEFIRLEQEEWRAHKYAAKIKGVPVDTLGMTYCRAFAEERMVRDKKALPFWVEPKMYTNKAEPIEAVVNEIWARYHRSHAYVMWTRYQKTGVFRPTWEWTPTPIEEIPDWRNDPHSYQEH